MFLNKSDILARLRELDLKSEGVSSKVDVLIVGGSALALLGESRLTSDIDYLSSLDYLPKDYLASLGFSNNVKTFFALYGTDEYSALELNGFKNLIVKILSYEDLAIMKLFSTRIKDLEDLIQYIFSKISSYSELKQKIETYKEYYVFNSELPELNLNQLDFIKDRLRKEQKVILVEDYSLGGATVCEGYIWPDTSFDWVRKSTLAPLYEISLLSVGQLAKIKRWTRRYMEELATYYTDVLKRK